LSQRGKTVATTFPGLLQNTTGQSQNTSLGNATEGTENTKKKMAIEVDIDGGGELQKVQQMSQNSRNHSL
jgi:hypothetical protein